MWIITGLGNPGIKYSRTRHNIGFMIIDRLSEEYRISLEEKDLYFIGKGAIEGFEVVLLKPLTFMNRSGIAVRKALKKFNVFPEKIADRFIVIHDDIDLEPGIIKIRRNGSSGGHKGIESIVQETGTRDFIRVKVGVGKDKDISAEEYVLSRFKSSEKNLIADAIITAAQAVAKITTEGIEKAMTIYNRSIKTDALPDTSK
ncbi:MAG: aminoacyl-tRNA hydrolase [Thermodesulfovibrio sp.]|nr:aminoacyl-tRNA hydrolase [Thermodesulfovibrio sp.]